MKKINYIDILIILFAFILLSVASYRFLLAPDSVLQSGREKAPKLSNAVVELKVEGIRDFNADLITEEAELLCVDAEQSFGKIFSKTTEPARTYVTVQNGETFISEHPEKKDVYLSLRIEGIQKETGFSVNNSYDIFIDDIKRFQCGDLIFNGQVKKIKVLD